MRPATGSSCRPTATDVRCRPKRGKRLLRIAVLTHVEEGASDRPLRAVFLELKEPAASGQVEAPSMTAAFPQAGGTQLRDTERAVVWEFAPPPPAASHRHLRDAVAVAFEGETPRVAFIAKGTVHTEEISGRSD